MKLTLNEKLNLISDLEEIGLNQKSIESIVESMSDTSKLTGPFNNVNEMWSNINKPEVK